jgi:hypothetical protein
MFKQNIELYGELSAIVIRADGHQEDWGVISAKKRPIGAEAIVKPRSWYEKLWRLLKREGLLPATMTLSAFVAYELGKHIGLCADSLAIVTAAGANYLAADFASGLASPHIGAFNYHDCGTGGAYGSTVSISGATNASPIVITTSSAHGLTTNDIVTVASVGGNTNANGTWQITVLSSTTFSLIGSSGNATYTSGGTVQKVNSAADTALTSPAGTARVSGTQSNPSSNQYRSVATISFTSTLSIVEWGLFSASTAGTLWDRRWFNNAGAPATTATGSLTPNPIGVNSGDSIVFTYTLTVNAGGS